MYFMKQKFNNDREKLRSELNSPIKQTNTTKLSILRMKSVKDEFRSPKSTERSSRALYSICKTPDIMGSSELSMKRLKFIDNIMDSCSDLDRVNKTDRKSIPRIEKQSQRRYKKVSEMVKVLEYMSPSNEVKSYMRFKKHIIDTENSLLQENAHTTRSATRIKSNLYLTPKLRNKNQRKSKISLIPR